MTDQPNIVVLFADQHRPDVLGAAGAPVETPNLDQLCERGVRCERAYSNSPLCGPGRACFASGVYAHNHHIIDNGGYLPADDTTVWSELQAAGYYTAHVGCADLGNPGDHSHLQYNEPYLHDLGFDYVHETTGPWGTRNIDSYMTDHWAKEGLLETFREDYERRQAESDYWPSPLPFEEHQDSYIGRQGVTFIEEYDSSDPFALFVGFGGPHDPMDPPESLFDKYDPDDMPDPLPDVENGDHVPDAAQEFMDQNGMTGEQQGWWRPNWDAEEARRWRALYFAKVDLIDHWVGEIVDALEAAGKLEDTIILYTGDHGETAGDHGTLTKQYFFESSVRIPMIFAGPGVESGGVNDSLIEMIDVYATLADVAGVENPRTFGESLVPILEAPDSDTNRDAVFASIRGHRDEPRTMIRTEQYKYCLGTDADGYALFDLDSDPGETRNLVGHPDYADVESDLRERALAFYHRTNTRYVRDGGQHRILEPGAMD